MKSCIYELYGMQIVNCEKNLERARRENTEYMYYILYNEVLTSRGLELFHTYSLFTLLGSKYDKV